LTEKDNCIQANTLRAHRVLTILGDHRLVISVTTIFNSWQKEVDNYHFKRFFEDSITDQGFNKNFTNTPYYQMVKCEII